jgi:hypothetical protein
MKARLRERPTKEGKPKYFSKEFVAWNPNSSQNMLFICFLRIAAKEDGGFFSLFRH